MDVLVLDLGRLQVNVLPVLVHAPAESILRHGTQEIRYMTPLIKILNPTTQTFLRVIENWKIRAIATKFAYPTQSLLKTMSLCIGLAMTVERWVAVCKPLEALARCTRKISFRMLLQCIRVQRMARQAHLMMPRQFSSSKVDLSSIKKRNMEQQWML